MKTIEEKRLAVIAEFERICPNAGVKAKVSARVSLEKRMEQHLSKGRIPTYYFLWDGIGWPINLWFSITPEWDAPDSAWDEAYRVLGLETRDAVDLLEETNRNYESDVNSLTQRLRDSEARDAKLVQALKNVKNTDSLTLAKTFALEALIENKKGGNEA